jgi:DNA-binding Xre family transcriptional regulator
MARIVSKARLLRWQKEQTERRTVPIQEVAAAIGVHYNTLGKIERGKTEGIDFDTLAALCAYYGVSVGEILEFDPNGIRTPDLVAA